MTKAAFGAVSCAGTVPIIPTESYLTPLKLVKGITGKKVIKF